MSAEAIMMGTCGRSSRNTLFCYHDFVKVMTTDPAHENDKDLSFCRYGAYGRVVGDFCDNTRFVSVQFVVMSKDDVEIIDVGLLCDNLKVINKTKEQNPMDSAPLFYLLTGLFSSLSSPSRSIEYMLAILPSVRTPISI